MRFSSENILRNGANITVEARKGISSLFNSGFMQSVFETYLTRIVLLGLGLGTSVIVARILGPEGRGLFAVAAAIGAIGVQFGNLGLHASNTYHAAVDRSLVPILIGNTLLVSFVFCSVVAAVFWIALHILPELSPLNGRLLTMSVSWIPFGIAFLLLQSIKLGLQDVRGYNRNELMLQIVSFVLLVFAVGIGKTTVEQLFLASLCGLVLGVVFVLLDLIRHSNGMLKISYSVLKEKAGFGMKVYLTDFAAFLVFRLDLLMVNRMIGAEQAGYYSISVALADMLYMLPVIVGSLLFPRLVAMPAEERWRYTIKIAAMVAVLSGLFSILITPFAGHIIRLLYGHAFKPAEPAFLLLLPGIFFISIQTIVVKYLAAQDYPVLITLSWILGLALNVILNLYLIKPYGISGASAASTIAYAFISVLILFYAVVRSRRKPASIEPRHGNA